MHVLYEVRNESCITENKDHETIRGNSVRNTQANVQSLNGFEAVRRVERVLTEYADMRQKWPTLVSGVWLFGVTQESCYHTQLWNLKLQSGLTLSSPSLKLYITQLNASGSMGSGCLLSRLP